MDLLINYTEKSIMNGKKKGGVDAPPNVQELLHANSLEHLYFIIDAPEESTKKWSIL
jgi:hypothetical protein